MSHRFTLLANGALRLKSAWMSARALRHCGVGSQLIPPLPPQEVSLVNTTEVGGGQLPSQ